MPPYLVAQNGPAPCLSGLRECAGRGLRLSIPRAGAAHGKRRRGLAWGHARKLSPQMWRRCGAEVGPCPSSYCTAVYEYQGDPPAPPQQENQPGRRLDAGAALVIGPSRSCFCRESNITGAGIIVYGLGNFAFEIDGGPAHGHIKTSWLDAHGVRQLEIVPGDNPVLAASPRLADWCRNRRYPWPDFTAGTHPLNPGRFP